MTCLTPGVCEAMLRAAARAASLGTWPDRVTIPPFAETAIEAVLSNGSANIFAWMSVVIVASFVLLHARHRNSGNEKKTSNRLRNIAASCRRRASRSSGGGNKPAGPRGPGYFRCWALRFGRLPEKCGEGAPESKFGRSAYRSHPLPGFGIVGHDQRKRWTGIPKGIESACQFRVRRDGSGRDNGACDL